MEVLYSAGETQEVQFLTQAIVKKFKIGISIGICAYNEERNISKLLDALLKQESKVTSIIEIIVVSSSTDSTNEIVQNYTTRDSRIRLVLQKKREGKASAVNLFLEEANGDVLVLQSADTLPEESTIEKLVEPFLSSSVGMTGGRPIPTNNRREFMGAISYLLWKLHHDVSVADVENPKCGELVAFRNIIENIPKDTAVDEAWIEMAIRKKGFSLRYAPDAVVYNHGPENIRDFLKQRRRIYSGHLHLEKQTGYKVSTMKISKLLKLVPFVIRHSFKELFYFASAVFLECYGRFLGAYDFHIKKKNPYVWDMATSTKKV